MDGKQTDGKQTDGKQTENGSRENALVLLGAPRNISHNQRQIFSLFANNQQIIFTMFP
jgi:hypothetical protein